MATSRSRLIMVKNGANWDPILARTVTFRHIEADMQRREFVTGQEGAQTEDVLNLNAGADIEVEGAPGGAAGTAPKYADLLKACGLTETVTAGVSVSYTPVPMGTEPTEIELQGRNANVWQAMAKVGGSLSFSAETARKPMFTMKMVGNSQAHAAPVVGPAPSFAGFPAAIECSPANMSAFTLGGVTLCVQSFNLSDGRSPMRGKFMNCDKTTNYSRAFTGRMVVEWPPTATKDLLALCKAGTTEPLIWQLGSAAGQIVRVVAPKVQIKYAGEQDIDGILAIALDLVFTPDQGDDDVAFIFS